MGARQVVYEVREKDTLLHPPFLFQGAALDFVRAHVKAAGKASSAYFIANEADPDQIQLRLYSDSNYLITIDEVNA